MANLSIIMPVYNSEKFLRRSIESVLSQTYKDWELILINDGSTDDSLEICREYEVQNSNIHVLSQTNAGAGSARNAGIEIATGRYLAFPDSDDRLLPDAYRTCVDRMVSTNADLLVFGTRTEVYNNDTGAVEDIIDDHVPEMYLDTREHFRLNWTMLYQSIDMGSPWNKIYKRSLIQEYRLKYPDLRRMQDGVFNVLYCDVVSSFVSICNIFYVRTWHNKEFQRKKMPVDFIECAIFHYRTIERTLSDWDLWDTKNREYFGHNFTEIVLTAEYDYLPQKNPSFGSVYKHIKAINNHPYVREFFNIFSQNNKLSKKEFAILKRWHFILAIDVYRKIAN